MAAPLDRIYHYKAKKGPEGPYIGATQNHLDVTNHFLEKKYKHCLVLEDDFLFHSNLKKCQMQLQTFFERTYDYQICFLGYSKQGYIESYDDLLCRSFQPCTTSSAYLLNASTANKIQECLATGVQKMVEGASTSIYCCDRYWAKLQSEPGFYLFADKLGYQRIMHSDITGKVNYHFD
jgi:GR25 family glycosyltransferase involved in LPS biosynthesis